jgi:glycosyltransferase involved in cell wall biosynthesis
MKIGLLAPCWLPVPPPGYGGIERVVYLLANGLVDLGHDVTLFASGDSRTKAKLESVFEVAPTERIGLSFWELRHVLHCYERASEFDVINDHSGPLAAALAEAVVTPVVHTIHGPLSGAAGAIYDGVTRVAPRTRFISVSRSQRRPRPGYNWLANCPNGLDLPAYPFSSERDDYLLFLGRMHEKKGAHRAAEVAMEAGLPLKIAGKMHEPRERRYFEEFVRPYLRDGIEYLGEVSHAEKVTLLQRARATLFPIAWDEPFGLVMLESMACGTPVVATAHGAVAEVIESGRSGIIVDDYRAIPDALGEADRLDPRELRRYVEERFSPARTVRDYAAALEHAVEGARA